MNISKSTVMLGAAVALCTGGWTMADQDAVPATQSNSLTRNVTPVNGPSIAAQVQAGGGVAFGGTIDQDQPSATVYMAAFSQPDLAQSFQTQQDDLPTTGAGIFLPPGSGTTGTVTIQLWDALPNEGGTMLAEGSAVGAPGEWVDVKWNGVALTPNTTYFLVFTGNTTLGIAGDTRNPYPHGHVYANAGYDSFPDFDYTFRTWIGAGSDCVGDLDNSGEVERTDLALLLGAWGPCDDPDDCLADLDGNGEVDGADLALLLGAWGECPGPPPPGCGSPGTGSCCFANGTPGCDDVECCETVCACDPFCCDTSWDELCAGEGFVPGCGAAVLCTELCDDCCVANGTPGCDDPDCEAAVCAVDPFCCDTSWDSSCAGEAFGLCGDLCGDGSDCCFANGTPGCDDPDCEATVCAVDPFCCDTSWDIICAFEAADLCGELCN